MARARSRRRRRRRARRRRRSRCRRRASSRSHAPSRPRRGRRSGPRADRTGCRIALADDVQVRLEDDDGRTLATGRRRNAHDDVALGVDLRVERPRGRPGEHVLARRPLLLRRPGDARQLGEALPEERRLERGERISSPPKCERGADHEQRDPEHARPGELRSARRRTSRSGRSPRRARTGRR